jgi:DNA-binding transcriptional ArsR family regulator
MRANVRKTSLPGIVGGDLCNVPCFKEDLVQKIQKRMPDEEALKETQTLFAALADRARLKILFAFQSGDELCVCDVAHVLGMSVSTASHHLRKLRDLRLLKYRNDGKMAYYSLRDEFAARVAVEALKYAEQNL